MLVLKIKTHLDMIEKWNIELKQNLVNAMETINESENKDQIPSDNLKPPTLS